MKKTFAVFIASLALACTGVAQAEAGEIAPTKAAPSQKACAPYPGATYTQTRLNVKKNVVAQGEGNSTKVRVRAQSGTPKGTIKLRIEAAKTGKVVTRSSKLSDGATTIKMPTQLKRGKYRVYARYVAKPCSRFAGSLGGPDRFRVTR